MKVLNAKVNWYERFANRPVLELLVDKISDADDFVYEERNCLFFAENDGEVSFFAYKGPGDGYYGRTFNIRMKDGSRKDLIGPWSSRAGCVNDNGFTKCLDVHFTDDPEAFKRGYTFMAGNVTLKVAQEAVEKFLPDVCLVRYESFPGDKEEVYHPALKNGFKKPDLKERW